MFLGAGEPLASSKLQENGCAGDELVCKVVSRPVRRGAAHESWFGASYEANAISAFNRLDRVHWSTSLRHSP
jgi:hypothetical protein